MAAKLDYLQPQLVSVFPSQLEKGIGSFDFSSVQIGGVSGDTVYDSDYSHIGMPIENSALRQKVLEGLRLTSADKELTAIVSQYLSEGIKQLSQSDIQRIRPYLSELITSDYSVALGITPKMSGLLQTCVNELPCDIDSLYELAKQSKTYMQQKLGMSDQERKFRENAYKVNPQSSELTYMTQMLYQTGVLTTSMSVTEISSIILEYVQSNYDYKVDCYEGSACDHWQTVNETIKKKTGDCEDLAILTASLLSNVLTQKQGYSQKEVSQMVTLSAGYVPKSGGLKSGHVVVKLRVAESQYLSLDATSSVGPVDFDSIAFDEVFEFNDRIFQIYQRIDRDFVTAEYISGNGYIKVGLQDSSMYGIEPDPDMHQGTSAQNVNAYKNNKDTLVWQINDAFLKVLEILKQPIDVPKLKEGRLYRKVTTEEALSDYLKGGVDETSGSSQEPEMSKERRQFLLVSAISQKLQTYLNSSSWNDYTYYYDDYIDDVIRKESLKNPELYINDRGHEDVTEVVKRAFIDRHPKDYFFEGNRDLLRGEFNLKIEYCNSEMDEIRKKLLPHDIAVDEYVGKDSKNISNIADHDQAIKDDVKLFISLYEQSKAASESLKPFEKETEGLNDIVGDFIPADEVSKSSPPAGGARYYVDVEGDGILKKVTSDKGENEKSPGETVLIESGEDFSKLITNMHHQNRSIYTHISPHPNERSDKFERLSDGVRSYKDDSYHFFDVNVYEYDFPIKDWWPSNNKVIVQTLTINESAWSDYVIDVRQHLNEFNILVNMAIGVVEHSASLAHDIAGLSDEEKESSNKVRSEVLNKLTDFQPKIKEGINSVVTELFSFIDSSNEAAFKQQELEIESWLRNFNVVEGGPESSGVLSFVMDFFLGMGPAFFDEMTGVISVARATAKRAMALLKLDTMYENLSAKNRYLAAITMGKKTRDNINYSGREGDGVSIIGEYWAQEGDDLAKEKTLRYFGKSNSVWPLLSLSDKGGDKSSIHSEITSIQDYEIGRDVSLRDGSVDKIYNKLKRDSSKDALSELEWLKIADKDSDNTHLFHRSSGLVGPGAFRPLGYDIPDPRDQNGFGFILSFLDMIISPVTSSLQYATQAAFDGMLSSVHANFKISPFLDYNMEKQILFRKKVLKFQNRLKVSLMILFFILNKKVDAAGQIGGKPASSISTLQSMAQDALDDILSKQMGAVDSLNNEATIKFYETVNEVVKSRVDYYKSQLQVGIKVASTVATIGVVAATKSLSTSLATFYNGIVLAAPTNPAFAVQAGVIVAHQMNQPQYWSDFVMTMGDSLINMVKAPIDLLMELSISDYKLPRIIQDGSESQDKEGSESSKFNYDELLNNITLKKNVYTDKKDPIFKTSSELFQSVQVEGETSLRLMSESDKTDYGHYFDALVDRPKLDLLKTTNHSKIGHTPRFSTGDTFFELPERFDGVTGQRVSIPMPDIDRTKYAGGTLEHTDELYGYGRRYIEGTGNGFFKVNHLLYVAHEKRVAATQILIEQNLLILKMMYDAIENEIALMFGAKKSGVFKKMGSVTQSNIQHVSSELRALKMEINFLLESLNHNMEKERTLLEKKVQVTRSALDVPASFSVLIPWGIGDGLKQGFDIVMGAIDADNRYRSGSFAGFRSDYWNQDKKRRREEAYEAISQDETSQDDTSQKEDLITDYEPLSSSDHARKVGPDHYGLGFTDEDKEDEFFNEFSHDEEHESIKKFITSNYKNNKNHAEYRRRTSLIAPWLQLDTLEHNAISLIYSAGDYHKLKRSDNLGIGHQDQSGKRRKGYMFYDVNGGEEGFRKRAVETGGDINDNDEIDEDEDEHLYRTIDTTSNADIIIKNKALQYNVMAEGYKRLTDYASLRSMLLMVETALYNQKQNSLKDMFKVSSSAGILDTAQEIVDVYNESRSQILGEIEQELATNVETENIKVDAGMDYAIEMAAQLIIVPITVNQASNYVAKTGPLTTKHMLLNSLKATSKARRAVSTLGKLVVGMLELFTLRPQSSTYINTLNADSENADDDSSDLKAIKDAEQQINKSKNKNNAPKETVSSRGQNIVQKGAAAAQKVKVKRLHRKLKLMMDILAALQETKSSIAGEISGSASGISFKKLSNIMSKYGTLDQKIMELAVKALEENLKAKNRAKDRIKQAVEKGFTTFTSGVISWGKKRLDDSRDNRKSKVLSDRSDKPKTRLEKMNEMFEKMKERLFPDTLFSDKKKTEEKNKVQSKLNSITRGHTASIFTLRLFEHLLLPGMEMAIIDSLWKSMSISLEDDVDGDVEPNNTADGTSYPTDGNSGSFGMASTTDLEDAALMADVEKGNLDVKRQLLEDQKKKIDRYKESMQKIKNKWVDEYKNRIKKQIREKSMEMLNKGSFAMTEDLLMGSDLDDMTEAEIKDAALSFYNKIRSNYKEGTAERGDIDDLKAPQMIENFTTLKRGFQEGFKGSQPKGPLHGIGQAWKGLGLHFQIMAGISLLPIGIMGVISLVASSPLLAAVPVLGGIGSAVKLKNWVGKKRDESRLGVTQKSHKGGTVLESDFGSGMYDLMAGNDFIDGDTGEVNSHILYEPEEDILSQLAALKSKDLDTVNKRKAVLRILRDPSYERLIKEGVLERIDDNRVMLAKDSVKENKEAFKKFEADLEAELEAKLEDDDEYDYEDEYEDALEESEASFKTVSDNAKHSNPTLFRLGSALGVVSGAFRSLVGYPLHLTGAFIIMGLGATGQLDDNDVLLQQSSANWKTFKANWKTFKGQDLDDKGNKKGLLKSWGESLDYLKKNISSLFDEESATEASRRRIKREAEVNNIPYKGSLAYHQYFGSNEQFEDDSLRLQLRSWTRRQAFMDASKAIKEGTDIHDTSITYDHYMSLQTIMADPLLVEVFHKMDPDDKNRFEEIRNKHIDELKVRDAIDLAHIVMAFIQKKIEEGEDGLDTPFLGEQDEALKTQEYFMVKLLYGLPNDQALEVVKSRDSKPDLKHFQLKRAQKLLKEVKDTFHRGLMLHHIDDSPYPDDRDKTRQYFMEIMLDPHLDVDDLKADLELEDDENDKRHWMSEFLKEELPQSLFVDALTFRQVLYSERTYMDQFIDFLTRPFSSMENRTNEERMVDYDASGFIDKFYRGNFEDYQKWHMNRIQKEFLHGKTQRMRASRDGQGELDLLSLNFVLKDHQAFTGASEMTMEGFDELEKKGVLTYFFDTKKEDDDKSKNLIKKYMNQIQSHAKNNGISIGSVENVLEILNSDDTSARQALVKALESTKLDETDVPLGDKSTRGVTTVLAKLEYDDVIKYHIDRSKLDNLIKDNTLSSPISNIVLTTIKDTFTYRPGDVNTLRPVERLDKDVKESWKTLDFIQGMLNSKSPDSVVSAGRFMLEVAANDKDLAQLLLYNLHQRDEPNLKLLQEGMEASIDQEVYNPDQQNRLKAVVTDLYNYKYDDKAHQGIKTFLDARLGITDENRLTKLNRQGQIDYNQLVHRNRVTDSSIKFERETFKDNFKRLTPYTMMGFPGLGRGNESFDPNKDLLDLTKDTYLLEFQNDEDNDALIEAARAENFEVFEREEREDEVARGDAARSVVPMEVLAQLSRLGSKSFQVALFQMLVRADNQDGLAKELSEDPKAFAALVDMSRYVQGVEGNSSSDALYPFTNLIIKIIKVVETIKTSASPEDLKSVKDTYNRVKKDAIKDIKQKISLLRSQGFDDAKCDFLNNMIRGKYESLKISNNDFDALNTMILDNKRDENEYLLKDIATLAVRINMMTDELSNEGVDDSSLLKLTKGRKGLDSSRFDREVDLNLKFEGEDKLFTELKFCATNLRTCVINSRDVKGKERVGKQKERLKAIFEAGKRNIKNYLGDDEDLQNKLESLCDPKNNQETVENAVKVLSKVMEQSEGQEQSFSGDLKEAHHVLGHVKSIEALFDKLGAVPSPAAPAPAADISSAFASVASLVSAAVPAVVSEVLSSAAAKASAAISDLAAAAKASAAAVLSSAPAAAVLSSAPAAAVALRVESVPSVEGIDIKGGMQFSYIERLCDPKLNSAFVKDRYGGRKVFINFDTLKILFGGKDPVTSIKYDAKFISCSEKGVCPKITFSEDGGDSVDAAYAKNGVLLNPANATNPGGGFNNPNKMDAMEENLCRRSNLASQLKAHEAYVGKGKYDVHLTTAHITKTTFKYSKSDKFDDSYEYKTPVDIPVVSIASPDMKEKAHLRQEEWEVEKQNYLEDMKLYWTTALQATKQASLDNPDFNPVLVAVTPGDFAKTGRVKEKDGSMKMKDGKPVIDPDIINIAAKALKDVYSTGKFNDVSIHFEQRTPTTQIFKDVLSA